mgnify:CR=1 FL=1
MYYIYQRISTQSQSLIRQEGIISEYCTQNNIEVPKEKVEEILEVKENHFQF